LWRRGAVHTEFWWGILRDRDHLEDSGMDGRIILRSTFRRWGGGVDDGLDWTGSRLGQVAGTW
jgi:hypothetical protein